MAKLPAPSDDARPPWRERAPEPRETVVSWRALIIGAVVAVVVAVALVVAVRLLIDRAERTAAADGEAPLIRAPEEPYKVRPADGAGAAVEGAGDSVFAAGEGADPIGEIAADALPETPKRPGAAPEDLLPPGLDAEEGDAALAEDEPLDRPAPTRAASAPVGKSAPAPSLPASAPMAADPAPAGGAALQLGAFSSRAAADAAWQGFAARFGYLAGLEKSVESVTRDGAVLYRLRAEGAGTVAAARALCDRLRVAGEECVVAR